MGLECEVLDCPDNKGGVCQDERILACYRRSRELGYSEQDNEEEGGEEDE